MKQQSTNGGGPADAKPCAAYDVCRVGGGEGGTPEGALCAPCVSLRDLLRGDQRRAPASRRARGRAALSARSARVVLS